MSTATNGTMNGSVNHPTAADWLKHVLSKHDKPVSSGWIHEEGGRAGFSRTSIYDASREIGVHKKKYADDYGTSWRWSLPAEKRLPAAKEPPPGALATDRKPSPPKEPPPAPAPEPAKLAASAASMEFESKARGLIAALAIFEQAASSLDRARSDFERYIRLKYGYGKEPASFIIGSESLHRSKQHVPNPGWGASKIEVVSIKS